MMCQLTLHKPSWITNFNKRWCLWDWCFNLVKWIRVAYNEVLPQIRFYPKTNLLWFLSLLFFNVGQFRLCFKHMSVSTISTYQIQLNGLNLNVTSLSIEIYSITLAMVWKLLSLNVYLWKDKDWWILFP